MVLGNKNKCKIDFIQQYYLDFFKIKVNVNIIDEEHSKAIQSYEPFAPVTRKGVLRSLRNSQSTEIRDEDLVRFYYYF